MDNEKTAHSIETDTQEEKIKRFARTGATVLKIFIAQKFHPDETGSIAKKAAHDVKTGDIKSDNPRISDTILEKVVCDKTNTSFDKFEALPAKQIIDSEQGFSAVVDDMSREEISRDPAEGERPIYAPARIPSAIFEEIYENPDRKEEFTRKVVSTGIMQKYVDYWSPFVEMSHEEHGTIIKRYATDFIKSLVTIKKFGVHLEDEEEMAIKELYSSKQ